MSLFSPAIVFVSRYHICPNTLAISRSQPPPAIESSTTHVSAPDWARPGARALLRMQQSGKNVPRGQTCVIIRLVTPYVAEVRFENGRKDTVSLRHLARLPAEPDDNVDSVTPASSASEDGPPLLFDSACAPPSPDRVLEDGDETLPYGDTAEPARPSRPRRAPARLADFCLSGEDVGSGR